MPQAMNSDFLRTALGPLQPGQFGWVCTFAGDPNATSPDTWAGRPYAGKPAQAAVIDAPGRVNAYFSTAVLRATDDGDVARRAANFARLAVLLADDADIENLDGQPTYILQTSPGKHQVGIVIDPADPDAADRDLVDRVLAALARRGGADPAGNACVRYGRLPGGINGKEGRSFPVQLLQWNPDQVLSLDDACAVLGLDLDEIRRAVKSAAAPRMEHQADRVEAWTQNILAGEQLHDSLRDLASHLVATGTAPGAAVTMLRALMNASQAPRDARWSGRLGEIPRLVTSAEQFRPAGSAPQITVNLQRPTDSSTPTVEGSAEHHLQVLSADTLPEASGSQVFDDELVEGVIGKSATAVLYGDSNSGKTFLAIDLCAAIARGAQWMDRRCEQGLVLYLATESPGSVQLRLRAYQRHHAARLAGFFVVTNPISLFDSEADIAAVIAVANQVERQTDQRVALVVGDTLARLSAGANENAGQDMGVVLRNVDRIREATGASFLLIHHTGKDQARGMRGWSGMRAFIDTELEVSADEATGTRVAEITKQRDLDGKGHRFGFRLQPVPVGVNKWGRPRTSAVVVSGEAPAKALAPSRQMGKVEHAVLAHLQRRSAGVWKKDVVAALADMAEPSNVYRALRSLVKAGAVHEAAGLVAAAGVSRQPSAL